MAWGKKEAKRKRMRKNHLEEAMRKVYVDLKVRLIIRADDGQSIEEVLENMDYDFVAPNDVDADIEDMEIRDWEITDSK